MQVITAGAKAIIEPKRFIFLKDTLWIQITAVRLCVQNTCQLNHFYFIFELVKACSEPLNAFH